MASVQTSSFEGRYLKLTVTEESTSIENNSSTVKWTLESLGGSDPYYSIYGCKVIVNGSTVQNSGDTYWNERIFPATTGSVSGTITVSHNDDGSANPISFSLTGSVYYNNPQTYSGTLSLSTIPRASEPTCANVTLGNSVTIYTNRKSSSFTHTIEVLVNNVVKQTFTNVGSSISWTPTIATYAPLNTSGSTISATIRCTTYNGSTQISTSKTCATTLTIPDNSSTKPVISSISIAEANAVMLNKNWGVYVEGKSQLAVTVNTSTKYGATISGYTESANGASYSSKTFTTGSLNGSGSKSITASVKDSRGFNSTQATQSYSVVPYANPTISTASAVRSDANGNEDDEGTYLKYTFNASVSAVSNHNTALYQIGYKKSTDASYTYITIANSGYTLNKVDIVLSDVTLDTNYTYDIIFNVTDAFTTSSINRTIPSGFDLLNFNASGKSMAIGKVSEATASEEKLEIALDTEYKGIPLLEYYTLYEDSTGTNGAVTLSDSVSNYEYIDIYFKETWSGHGGFVQRISTSNTYFQLFCNISRSGYNEFMSMAKGYVFNGNTIQKNQYANFVGIYFYYYSMSQPQWLYENDYIYITKVVGYK